MLKPLAVKLIQTSTSDTKGGAEYHIEVEPSLQPTQESNDPSAIGDMEARPSMLDIFLKTINAKQEDLDGKQVMYSAVSGSAMPDYKLHATFNMPLQLNMSEPYEYMWECVVSGAWPALPIVASEVTVQMS